MPVVIVLTVFSATGRFFTTPGRLSGGKPRGVLKTRQNRHLVIRGSAEKYAGFGVMDMGTTPIPYVFRGGTCFALICRETKWEFKTRWKERGRDEPNY
jgi:hypothetical protein